VSQNYETFGKYILLDKIAMGGMAEVYLARNIGVGGVGKFVAIKRILPQFSEQTEFVDMFKDEAKIAINLSHSNIVSLHEFGMEHNQFFIVMDFVEGCNLRQIMTKMKKSGLSFSIEQVLYIIREISAGLDHAHRCLDSNTGKPLNIIHRDMSPQNIMISFEGEAKIVDFGIAKAETQLETTRAGTLKGKFGYMSPEQAEGQLVDLRTDVFSLGIVLWELLASDRLFVANNEINTLRKIRDCQIPSLRKINPNIPPELERIVSKVLARDRNMRYQDSASFHREISRFLNRQYPDFSPQDFAVFIKTLFQTEVIESRKKLVQFAQIDFNSISGAPKANFDNDKTTLTSTVTESSNTPEPYLSPPTHANMNSPAPSLFDSLEVAVSKESNEGKVEAAVIAPDFRVLQKSHENAAKQNRPKVPDQQNEGRIRGYHSSIQTQTNLNRSLSNHKKSSENMGRLINIALLLVALTGFGGGIVFWSKNPKVVQASIKSLFLRTGLIRIPNQADTSATESASTEAVTPRHTISIDSRPSGSTISIDGRTWPGASPMDIELPLGTPGIPGWPTFSVGQVVTIKLTNKGHFDYEQRIQLQNQAVSVVSPVLKEFGKATLNIVVDGSGEVFINEKLVSKDGSKFGLQVPANQNLRVKVVHSVTGALDYQDINLKEAETRDIKLIPRAQSLRH
jgi:serine/threonine-protein kinase